MENKQKIKHMIVDLEGMTEPYAYDSETYQDIKNIVKLLEELLRDIRD